MIKKIDIKTIGKKDLELFCTNNNTEKFRANQIEEWLWKKGAKCFDEMTSLPASFRFLLSENFIINSVEITSKQVSVDRSIKYGLKLFDKKIIEGVLIPSKKRVTICISSQAGCSLDCFFCATGKLKLERNLMSWEIYEQVYLLNKESIKEFGVAISNIVYMGMGEPLLNYSNVIQSIGLITDNKGLGMSPKRITVSTSGIAKMIKKLGDDQVKFNLAISLHSANNKTRSSLMPINKRINLAELKKSIVHFYKMTKTRITYEYILFEKINDSINDANELAELTKITPCKINLIEYNPIEGVVYKKSDHNKTKKFISILESKNLIVNLRKSKGKDIDAACGQLANRLS